MLIPAAADQLDIPIIASGGIADARGLVAALALGADAMNMGTRFMCTAESPIHENVKQHLVQADERQTDLIFRSFRNTARVAKNSVEPAGHRDREERRRVRGRQGARLRARGTHGLRDGDPEAGIWSAGLCQGLIHDVPTCGELVDRMMSEAEEIITGRLAGLLNAPVAG